MKKTPSLNDCRHKQDSRAFMETNDNKGQPCLTFGLESTFSLRVAHFFSCEFPSVELKISGELSITDFVWHSLTA